MFKRCLKSHPSDVLRPPKGPLRLSDFPLEGVVEMSEGSRSSAEENSREILVDVSRDVSGGAS